MPPQSFPFSQLVKARPSQVYHAFTNSTALREWMCDLATTDPKPGGRIYMAWNSGFYMAGEFLALEENQAIIFTWNGRNEPAPTLVRVKLTEQNGATLVELTHEEVGVGKKWQKAIREIQEGWKSSLENLASVLETGQDLRITLRPMLGIIPSDYNAEIAARLGVPVTYGVRLDGVVDGMGAQKAGLQANDVLVKIAGHDLKDGSEFVAALQGRRAGDQIDVVFYRGGEKHTIKMELSKRRLPDIPDTIAGLADAVGKQYDQMQSTLDQFFAGVSEAEAISAASFKASPEDWSIKEVLAHLISSERFWRQHVAELVASQESWTDGFGGNWQGAIDATLAAYPTLQALLTELKQQCVETRALYTHLPAEFLERKGSFWRLSIEALQVSYHLDSHMQQMQTALAASRK